MSKTSKTQLSNEEDLSEMQKSMISEIGSTIILRYVAALNKMLNVDSLPKQAPNIKIETALNAIKNIGYREEEHSEVVLIQLDLFTEENKFECHMFVQPHPKSREKYRKVFHLI